MKLELKHLSAYLPYKVMCLNQHLPDVEFVKEELIGISNHIVWSGAFNAIHGSNNVPVSAIKPILYPLDYLTKPITHNGETFVPIDNLEKGENGSIYSEYSSDGNKTETISITYKMMGDTFTDFIINRNSIDNTDYKYVQKLIEWKFDIFNLIENNLAIAVTETFNPYEK